jgi:Zn-dependent M28 family amino/carboxypeptidase
MAVAAVLVAACRADGRSVSSTTTTAAPRPSPKALVAAVDEGGIRSTLTELVGTRVTADERAHARALLAKRLRDAGLAVAEEPFGDGGVNLIGTIEGRDPKRDAILLSAHYDTVPGSPGADDDGSGVTAVVEAARVLAKARLDAPVEVALFDLEELGLVGSAHHVTTTRRIAAGFNLDMVGYSCTTPGCQVVFPDIENCLDSEGARDIGVGVAAVADAQSGALLDTFVRARDELVPQLYLGTGRLAGHGECLDDTRRSDHAPYWDAGTPVVFLTDTANFRNPNYHQPSDRLESVDFTQVADVSRALVAAVAALDAAATGAGSG